MNEKIKELLDCVKSLSDYRIDKIYNQYENGKLNDQFDYQYYDEWNHGDGNEMGLILYFQSLNTYVRFLGVYSSWGDPYWDTTKTSIVYPHEVVKTVWNYKPQTLGEVQTEIDRLVELERSKVLQS